MARARISKWKKYRKIRRAVRKYKNRKTTKTGAFRLVRRLQENTITNSSTLGIATASGNVIYTSGGVSTGFSGYYNCPGSAKFALSDILNSTDITNLFDKYRLAWVKIKVYCTSTTATAGGTAQLPSMIWSLDEDDNTFPTVASLREKMGSKQRMFYPGKPITIFIRAPKVQRQLDTSALLSSGNEIARAPWINCSYADVPHYGFKFALLDVNLNTTASVFTQFKFDITYCVHARDAQ